MIQRLRRFLIACSCLPIVLSFAAKAQSPHFEPGDLLFKPASTGFWTEIAASYSKGDKRWGHVGVVTDVSDSSITVVHADMGPPETVGVVRSDTYDDFIGEAAFVGQFRIALSDHERTAFNHWIRKAAADAMPFDRGYSLASANNAYCTELVWRAWSAAVGRDPIPDKGKALNNPYVALSDLTLHPDIADIRIIEIAP